MRIPSHNKHLLSQHMYAHTTHIPASYILSQHMHPYYILYTNNCFTKEGVPNNPNALINLITLIIQQVQISPNSPATLNQFIYTLIRTLTFLLLHALQGIDSFKRGTSTPAP